MTTALTPALALSYLNELSLDVRAAVVLDVGGEPLAGERALAQRARRLLQASGPAASGVLRERAPDGTLLLARAGGATIAVLTGPCALLPLLEHDLARIAEALDAPDLPS
ncbi:MAG TPA: hypothetical protein VK506_15760 [Conexibacter sp.]|nr:hypothetical protein [Conexibacter sp.]